MEYQKFKDDELGLRDHLAMDRTAMANERTFLAYARTALMLAATSVTLFKLFHDSRIAHIVAVALIPMAFLVGVAGTRRYLGLFKALKSIRR